MGVHIKGEKREREGERGGFTVSEERCEGEKEEKGKEQGGREGGERQVAEIAQM